MIVKNTGKKTIGFGELVLPPDAESALPEGYGPDHPTVVFYVNKKWLTEISVPGSGAGSASGPAMMPAGITTKIRGLGKMNLDPLRTEASALGVEWAEDDTKATLVQKITEKLLAGAG